MSADNNSPNPLELHKFVRVMPDYCSTGLWSRDGASSEIENAQLDAHTLEKLKAWNALYENTASLSHLSKSEQDRIFLKGLEVAQLIKAQHPSWQVVFYSDGMNYHYILPCVPALKFKP